MTKAQTDSYETILKAEVSPAAVQGDNSTQTVDVVILGDGYTAYDMPKYLADAEYFKQTLFSEEPFRDCQRFFNVRRLDKASNESGADFGGNNSPCTANAVRFGNYTGCYKDTYFNATFNHPDSRALLVDSNKVRIYLAEVLGAPQTSKYDMIVILVNDVKYGGSGGGVAVMATYSPTQSYVPWQYNTLHEIGLT